MSGARSRVVRWPQVMEGQRPCSWEQEQYGFGGESSDLEGSGQRHLRDSSGGAQSTRDLLELRAHGLEDHWIGRWQSKPFTQQLPTHSYIDLGVCG